MSEGKKLYAGVRLIDLPVAADREYDYSVPEQYEGGVYPGRFVSVPFGKGNRRFVALVTRVSESPASEGITVKPIYALCSDGISFSDEQLKLLDYIRSITLCPTGDAIHAMIPSAALSKLDEFLAPTEKPYSGRIGCRENEVYTAISAAGSMSAENLHRRFGRDGDEAVKRLLRQGYLARELTLSEHSRKTVSYYALKSEGFPSRETLESLVAGNETRDGKGHKIRALPEGQKAVLSKLLAASTPQGREMLTSDGCASADDIRALVKKDYVLEIKNETDRDTDALLPQIPERTGDIVLNREQQTAYDALCEMLEENEPHAALLEGVTGSGKTCVMLRLIDRALELGKGVILLIPEISLTPQTLSVFCSRYGERVAVMHSGLSAGERGDAYLRVREGRADLVIGTRSAIFAPVRNPGLIIIDEEQEHTYKSDTSPRYHARDIARFRCAAEKGLLLLASATPSLESRQKAEDKKYTLIRMNRRYGNSVLPKVTVADMRHEPAAGNLTPIGSVLAEKLKQTYEKGEQSVLFLNRRGYNNYLSCTSCGKAVTCPNCSVSLTYHVTKKDFSQGELRCHWCGLKMPVPKECPECGEGKLIRMGFGTQKVEEELGKILPGARILRMDTDSTQGRYSYGEMLGKFRRHEADVLLGTQMVTKGHDFPDVTLVGVLLADASLYYDDYRAAERTFALLTQVIGRAGRRERPGEAVIQTNNPDHEIIALAGAQDYEKMFAREIKLRRSLKFPPFCDIALITVSSEDERRVVSGCAALADRIRELSKSEKYRKLPLIMYGPFEAPVYKVGNRFRMRLVIKCALNRDTKQLFAELLQEYYPRFPDVPVAVDFNPTNL